jgi:tRNA(adenine34) deaminase
MNRPDADEVFMHESLAEASAAALAGEVPIGAVVVQAERIIGRGRNSPIAHNDPTAHAEIMALRAAGCAAGNYRLVDAELFVTVEPCVMCVGAIIHARVRRVIYGCADPKAGALGSALDLSGHGGFNHRFAVRAGVCESDARELLQRFFRSRRGIRPG